MPDFSPLYNTPIPKAKQPAFDKWLKAHPKAKSDYYDYDVQGFWLSGAGTDTRGHGTDKFKKPNHPTFSVESKYSTPENPGGRWVQQRDGHTAFVADPSNLRFQDRDDLQQYFQKIEPGIRLELPPDAPGPKTPPLPAGLENRQHAAASKWEALSGPSFPQLAQFVKNLISNPQPVPASHFFQSRITRTPGGMSDLAPGVAGAFEPGTSPIDAVKSSDLPEDLKKQLIAQWSKMGKGFIRVPPEGVRSDVMRHEQLHALQQNAGLSKHAKDIAARVSPEIQEQINASPIYQNEMKQFGKDQTMADEGTAIDLISMANRSGGPSKALKAYVSSVLGPAERKQFERLTAQQQ